MRPWVYAAICVAVPAVWGLVMTAAFSVWERRTGRRRRVDYSI